MTIRHPERTARVNQLMTERYLGRNEFIETVGTNPVRLIAALDGKDDFSLSQLANIAEAYDVDFAWLHTGIHSAATLPILPGDPEASAPEPASVPASAAGTRASGRGVVELSSAQRVTASALTGAAGSDTVLVEAVSRAYTEPLSTDDPCDAVLGLCDQLTNALPFTSSLARADVDAPTAAWEDTGNGLVPDALTIKATIRPSGDQPSFAVSRTLTRHECVLAYTGTTTGEQHLALAVMLRAWMLDVHALACRVAASMTN